MYRVKSVTRVHGRTELLVINNSVEEFIFK